MSTNGLSNGHSKTQGILHMAGISAPPIAPAPIAPPVRPPWSQTVTVTPEIAKQWITANVSNRRVRKGRVQNYARDMAAGNWLFSTQGLAFGTDGSLIDGQHRLLAVIAANVPVQMLVWFDVPMQTREVIDIGDPRRLGDIANLTQHQAAVTLAMMRGPAARPITATMAERHAFYRRFQAQIDGVIALFPSHRRGITQASVIGAIVRASLYMKDADVARFCDVLWTGIGDPNTRDRTVIHLRDRLLLSDTGGVGSRAQHQFHGMALASLRAFDEGRTLSKIYPATIDNDPFPLPAATRSE